MGKDKLRRFAEIATFKNVFQLEEGQALRGKWAGEYFGNDHPVILELACGKGEYTVALAKLFPLKNFIGVDYKGNRIWRGAKTSLEEGIENVAFLRIQIEHILEFFAPGEIAEIWITFPDPQPQVSRERKRLTSPRFLEMYQVLLEDDGIVHLKTDDAGLFSYSTEKAGETGAGIHELSTDVYDTHPGHETLGIKTYYEKKYLKQDIKINYLKFSFGKS